MRVWNYIADIIAKKIMIRFLNNIYTKFEKIFKLGLFVLLKRLLNNPQLTSKIPAINIHRILILRYDVIGDMIVTLPSIQYLKLMNPNIKIDVLASSKNAGIIQYDTNVHKIYIHDIPIWKRLQLFRTLKRNNYDIIFPCVTNKATYIGLISNLIKSKNTIISTPSRYEKYYFLFHYQSKLAKQQQSIWNTFLYLMFDTIETSILPEVAQPYVNIPDFISQTVLHTIHGIGTHTKQYVLINLSTRHQRNEWSDVGFEHLIQHIITTTNYSVLLTCMDYDSARANKFALVSDKVMVYPTTKEILEVVTLVKNALLVITPDTGIVHMASATKTPLVALYVGDTTAPEEWGPFRLNNYFVVTSKNGQNVDTIEPEEVLSAVDTVIRKL